MKLLNRRLALAAAMSLTAFGATGASAWAQDDAVLSVGPPFRLDATNLEPGCQQAAPGTEISDHVGIKFKDGEAHIALDSDAGYSIAQALVADDDFGYKVVNTFRSGPSASLPMIDPGYTAIKISGLSHGLSPDDFVICVTDHDGPENEPYVAGELKGEVAALNRPIVKPMVSALGVSSIGVLNTYKAAFGYTNERWYDRSWYDLFDGTGFEGGDPMASPDLDSVRIDPRIKQPGALRFNDVDQFSEAFNGAWDDYGQPTEFDMAGNPFAYIHDADTGLLSFTTQGDLPIAWSVRASLAPKDYARTATLTDEFLRTWETSWQAYYQGQGPKPTLALPPGTNSPAPVPGTPVVEPPEERPSNGAPQQPMAPAAVVTLTQQAAKATPTQTQTQTAKKTKLRSSRLVKKGKSRAVQVFVASDNGKAHLRIRLYNKAGKKLKDATKTVATNRFVKVNVKVAKQVSTVKTTVLG